MAIVRMTAKDGMDVYIETDERAETTLVRRSQDAEGKSFPDVPPFGQVGERIATVCAEVRSAVDATKELRPDQLTLQFGIKLAGETGLPYVASGKVEASFVVTAVWKRE